MGNPEAAAVFFEPWSVLACNTEGAWEDFVAAVKKEPCCEDMEPTDADKKAVRLLKKHQAAIYAEFHRTLDSRPKTLTHGDMRADNMFRRKDGSGFTVIDWQTYGAAPPGVEMHQLFANQIDDLSLYASRHAGARPSSFAEQTLLRAGQAARAHARVPRRAAPAVPGGARVHLRYALGGFPDLRRNRVHVHGHRAWAGPSQTECILPRARCQRACSLGTGAYRPAHAGAAVPPQCRPLLKVFSAVPGHIHAARHRWDRHRHRCTPRPRGLRRRRGVPPGGRSPQAREHRSLQDREIEPNFSASCETLRPRRRAGGAGRAVVWVSFAPAHQRQAVLPLPVTCAALRLPHRMQLRDYSTLWALVAPTSLPSQLPL